LEEASFETKVLKFC